MILVCIECSADMIETAPDSFCCPRCGFRADQTSIPLETEGRQLQVPNEKGWLTKEEVKRTGKPILIPDPDGTSGKWHNGNPPGGGLLLTRTSCEKFCPVREDEEPAAYAYNSKAAGPHRYIPFFFRTKEQIEP